jgi:hypothetical protein
MKDGSRSRAKLPVATSAGKLHSLALKVMIIYLATVWAGLPVAHFPTKFTKHPKCLFLADPHQIFSGKSSNSATLEKVLPLLLFYTHLVLFHAKQRLGS